MPAGWPNSQSILVKSYRIQEVQILSTEPRSAAFSKRRFFSIGFDFFLKKDYNKV